MAAEKREQGTPLKERLFKEPYGFSFFMAVNLLESYLFPEKKQLGSALSPNEEAVRFTVKPGLVFPPSDIVALNLADDEKPADMGVTFMGLIGPAGVLPHWYNELAIERNRQKDYSLTSFLDIFHHRLISLFYLAWKKNRWQIQYLPGARDNYSGFLLSFLGLGTPGLASRLGQPEESLIFYSGLLSRPVPSIVAIEAAVEYFSDARAEVDPFIDRIVSIDPEEQTKIGSANARLGVDAVCGSCAWENQTKFRVNIGAMGYTHFVRFLPSGELLAPIFELVRYMAGIEYEFEIRVILKREEVPLCTIGMETPAAPRLGWSTWVKSADFIHQEDPSATFSEADVGTETLRN
jgi:type VI secretion system protein ImpH